MALRLRRGTDAERQIITPVEGELVYVTDTKELYIGDGTTVGGIRVTGEVADTLDGLTDVDAALPQDGDILVYDSLTSEWESVQLPLTDLPDVNALSPNDGDILRYDSNTQVWVAVSLAEEQVTGNLEDLDNVVIAPDSTEPTNGQTLLYDSQSGVWYNGNFASSISSSLEDLDNVVIAPDSTEPTNGQVLMYDSLGEVWFNGDFSVSDLLDVSIVNPLDKDALLYDANNESWYAGSIDLESEIAPELGGNLNANGFDISNIGLIEAESFVGDVNANTLSVNNITPVDPGKGVEFITSENLSRLNFQRRSDSAIPDTTSVGRILFSRKIGAAEPEIITSISVTNDQISFIPQPGGTPNYNNYFKIYKDGKVQISIPGELSNAPTDHLEVGGNGSFTGTVTAASFKGSVVADDSTEIVDAINSKVSATIVATAGTAPSLVDDPGDTGEIRFDDSFIYVKTPSGDWKKVALSSL